MIRRLYASAGEVVTCTKGHNIADIKYDIYYGEAQMNSATDFRYMTPRPYEGTELHNCKCGQCGEPYVTGPGITLHFPDGWRFIAKDENQ